MGHVNGCVLEDITIGVERILRKQGVDLRRFSFEDFKSYPDLDNTVDRIEDGVILIFWDNQEDKEVQVECEVAILSDEDTIRVFVLHVRSEELGINYLDFNLKDEIQNILDLHRIARNMKNRLIYS